MPKTYDAIVIGGGIIGAAAAYYLSKEKLKVAIIEKEFLCSGSTGRCIAGIRQQFTSPASIQVAKESVRIFESLADEFGFDVEWHQGGYLFLAHSQDMEKAYLQAIEIQKKFDLDVRYISVQEAQEVVPDLNADGLLGAAYGPLDGQANPFLVVDGYARGVRLYGGGVLNFSEVVGLSKHKNFTVQTKNAVFETPVVVNAAGPSVSNIAALLDIKIPAVPDRHEALITERYPKFMEPMVVDYRGDGCYFQQLHPTGQLIGCYTPDPKVIGTDVSSTSEFLREMGRRMVRIIPRVREIRALRQWSGSYTMSPDGNPIVDETEIENFYVAGAMSGHGFMFGPAIGKLVAELVTKKRTTIDITEFSLKRKFGEIEGLK